MPLLPFFAAVGSILLCLVLLAENILGPAEPSKLSNNSAGLPTPWKPPAPIVPLVDAPPATTAAIIPPAATPPAPTPPAQTSPAQTSTEQPAKPPKKLASAKKKRMARLARQYERSYAKRMMGRGHYAQTSNHIYGRVW